MNKYEAAALIFFVLFVLAGLWHRRQKERRITSFRLLTGTKAKDWKKAVYRPKEHRQN